MTSSHEIRLERARQSLEGLSLADALGGFFEGGFGSNNHFVKNRKYPEVEWHFTDDSNMALSIYSILRQFESIKQDELARSFALHYDKSRGYGRGARFLLTRVQKGEYWVDVAKDLFRGEGSFGNGGAMRVAPLGAYFADDMPTLIENARLSAEITHAHSEGIAGAIAVAVAASLAVSYRDKSKPTIPEFFDQVLSHIPESDVKENCETAKLIPHDLPIDRVVGIVGNGRNVSAMDTVPYSIWCAANWLDDFEEAFWQTASGGGDVDTTCAIVGGIIGARSTESIPAIWIEHREKLPDWAFEEVTSL